MIRAYQCARVYVWKSTNCGHKDAPHILNQLLWRPSRPN